MRHATALALCLAVSAPLGACLQRTSPAVTAQTASRFGQPLTRKDAVPLATVLGDPDGYAGKTVLVEGKVRAACRKRGCWMELAPALAKGAQGCRVTFQDYGFFVPTDSAGASAKVEGVVNVRTVPAAEVAHLEGEGAFFAKKETDGSAREVRIVATGVELAR